MRKRIDNLNIVTTTSTTMKKHYITALPNNCENDYSMFQNVMKYTKSETASIVSCFVFGSRKLYDTVIEEFRKEIDEINWPITWLHGKCGCEHLTGIQIVAVSGVKVTPVILDGEIVGNIYEDDAAKYCELSNIHSKNSIDNVFDNSYSAFKKMDKALNSAGMDFGNVIRMWNYLDKLLTWYDNFNVMRTAFFTEHNIFGNIVPAATGISTENSNNTPYVGALFAVKPKKEYVNYFSVDSPLQCPALDYKSSFARAVELDMTEYRYLSISGTASIERSGKTVFHNDVLKQIEFTMKVVEAILESRNMNWINTAKAIAYFPYINDIYIFQKYLNDNNYPDIPIAYSHTDICRDDLLFEIELDAIKNTCT